MKIFNDILKIKSKYSFKRVTAIYVLNIAVVYAFTPLFAPKFAVLEFVMLTLIGYSASMMGMSVWQKNAEIKDTTTQE